MHLPEKYWSYRDEFVKMLAEYKTMWNGPLGVKNVAKYRTDLTNNNVYQVYSALYRFRLAACKFAAAETDRMLAENVIETATTE